jgi:hypothetical protein
MAKKSGMGVSTDAVLGGGIRGSLEAKKQECLEGLNEEIVALRSAAEDIQSLAGMSPVSLDGIAEPAAAEITGVAESASAELSLVAFEKQAAKRFQIAFQIKHNIDRQPIVPRLYDSLPMLTGLTLVEGVATSAFFFGGGFVSGIGEAAVLGLTISSVNVVLSAGLGGHVFGRYWNYGTECREQDLKIKIKRWAGRVGSVLTAGGIGSLLLASGIVRATGETEHLSFTFESLLEAASDFHSLMLWGIGLCFSILSWKKGLSAFSDPYPGLAEAAKAVSKASETAQGLREDAFGEIEDIHQDALDALSEIENEADERRQEFNDTLQDFRHDRERLVSAISQAETDFEAFRAEQVSLHYMVSGEKPVGWNTPGIDTEKLTAQIPSISIGATSLGAAAPQASKHARDLLANARKSAVETIAAAYKHTVS